MENIDCAIRLASLGWKVFPCREKQTNYFSQKNGKTVTLDVKTPYTKNGYKDAVDTFDEIYDLWEPNPNALVGIACEPSGLIALDLDRHPGQADGVNEFVRLLSKHRQKAVEVGPAQLSPGNGIHYVFQSSNLPGVFKVPATVGPGIDIRYKGYICTGILENGQRYKWFEDHTPDAELSILPEWILEEMANNVGKHKTQSILNMANQKTYSNSPMDDFESRTSWEVLLDYFGWKFERTNGETQYWTRPGKRNGISATLNFSGKENLFVFSSNAAPLESQKSYTKVGFYTTMAFDGDYKLAAKTLKEQGFGS